MIYLSVYLFVYCSSINVLNFFTEFERFQGDKLELKRNILTDSSLYLGKNLQLRDLLIKLNAYGAITVEHKEIIEHKITSMSKVDGLIDCLRLSPNTQYFKFMAVLEKEHKGVYNEVLKIQTKLINGNYSKILFQVSIADQ